MNIAEIRQQYPEYSDLSDADLAAGLHKKHYSDMPFDEFSKKIGLAPPTVAQRILTSSAGRFLKGANSIVEGGAELLPYALGSVAGGFGAFPNKASEFLFDESRRVRQMNADNEKGYQQARKATGSEGMDIARGAGGLASGLATGLALPAAPASTLGRIGFGAMTGGLSGAMSPTGTVDDTQYAKDKALQMAAGGLAGAVATPIVGKVVDKAGPLIDKVINRFTGGPKMSDAEILQKIEFEFKRDGVDFAALPESMRSSVAKQVKDSLKVGQNLDGAAAARKIDLDRFGGGTQGQITRDPSQWNKEFNLRQVENAGEPLVDQARNIRTKTGEMFSEMGAASPRSQYEAGQTAVQGLSSIDSMLSGKVDRLYQAARTTDGRYAPLDTPGFSQMANNAIDQQMLGTALPEKARTLLNKVSTGEIPLDVNTAVQFQRRLAGMSRDAMAQGDKEGAKAIGEIIGALNKTNLVDDAAGLGAASRQAFDDARKAAAFRFGLHEKIPGLKAAAEGTIEPEKFVSKFVTGDSVDNVKILMRALPDQAKQAVREQVIKDLEKAAFGTNVAKDTPMSVERFNAALKSMGKEKLGSIFPEEVVDDLYRIGRVNAYVNQQPAGVTPNRSGTAGAMMNLLQGAKGIPMGLGSIRGAVNSAQVSSALSPNVPSEPIPVLTPALLRLLGGVPVGAGLTTVGQ